MKNCMKLFFTSIAVLLGVTMIPVYASAENGDVIKDGVYVEGINLSGKTEDEAEVLIEGLIQSLDDKQVTFLASEGNQVTVSVGEIGLKWNNTNIAEEAVALGQKGNVVSRYKQKKDLEHNNYVFELDYSLDRKNLEAILVEKCSSFDQHATNAEMVRENGQFVIREGADGFVINVDKSAENIIETLEDNWDFEDISIELVGEVEKPKGSKEDLAKIKDLLGTFTTSYSSSNAARSANISNGASKINGTLLFPGEEFSCYDTVKPFTGDNGYQMAGSYLNGLVVDSMGGGICQVSTTLYEAVLQAELEILERNNHSMVVTYVQVSGDAAISESSGKDFRFRNNTEYPIYIEGVTADKKITFNIYGVETRPSNRTVTFENEILQVIQPDHENIIADASQGIGYVKVQGVHVGYKARLWKVVKVDGEEVERVQINSSNYAMSPRTAIVGVATTNPDAQAQIMAAISTGSIDYVKAIAGSLYAQQVAAASGQ